MRARHPKETRFPFRASNLRNAKGASAVFYHYPRASLQFHGIECGYHRYTRPALATLGKSAFMLATLLLQAQIVSTQMNMNKRRCRRRCGVCVVVANPFTRF